MGPAVNIMKKLCYAFSIQNKSTVVDGVEEVCAMRDAVFAFGADRTRVSSEQVPFPVVEEEDDEHRLRAYVRASVRVHACRYSRLLRYRPHRRLSRAYTVPCYKLPLAMISP